jgi:hypothetical protein
VDGQIAGRLQNPSQMNEKYERCSELKVAEGSKPKKFMYEGEN